MRNETKFFQELKEFEQLTNDVSVEEDGTIIISKETKTDQERSCIVAKAKQLFTAFKGKNNA